MKRIMLLSLLLVFALCGCAKDKAAIGNDEKIMYVKTSAATNMSFERAVTVSGVVKAEQNVTVTGEVGGTIESVPAEIGDEVKKGDLLCKIDDTSYRLQFNKAQAGVKNAQATLGKIKNYDANSGLEPQAIQAARTEYNTSLYNYEKKEKEFKRTQELYKQGAISQSEYESDESDYKITKERYQDAKAALEQAKRAFAYDLKGAEASLAIADSDAKLMSENLKDTTVLSPINGIISDKKISVGENISMGSNLFNIVNIDNVYIESGVSEKDIGYISEGQEVLVTIDSLSGETHKGKLIGVSPALDPTSKVYAVKAIVENTDHSIKDGMFARISIAVDKHDNALGVNKTAVMIENDKHYVFVDDNGVAKKKPIEIGYSNDEYYEVKSGLTQGEKVITVSSGSLKEGMKVAVKQ